MDSRIFANPELWQLWTYCLLRANHSKQWVPVCTGKGTTEVEVLPGQCIFGRHTWAKTLKTNPSTLWKRMLKLKTLGFLDMLSGSSYSVVTIKNWEFYQKRENDKVTGKVTMNGKRSQNEVKMTDTDKNDKKGNNDKKYTAEFDLLWSQYPKKDGRKEALRHFTASVKTDKNLADIKTALENYNSHIAKDKIEQKFIKNGSTWFNNWEDWISKRIESQPKRGVVF